MSFSFIGKEVFKVKNKEIEEDKINKKEKKNYKKAVLYFHQKLKFW